MEPSTEQLAVVPELKSTVDLTAAGLSMEEGFVVSRVDGRTCVKDIAHLVGKSPEETHRILSRLAKSGVVVLGEVQRAAAEVQTPEAAREADYGDFVFDQVTLEASCDLSREEKKRILFFHAHLEEWSHYELLQVRRSTNAKDVKRAYFARSKEWHPDRFRRPNLGPYKSMIDKIFQGVQAAYRVLSDDKKRAEYNARADVRVGKDEIADVLKEQRRSERDERRRNDAEERRRKHNPMRQRMAKARRFYLDAQQLRDNGQIVEALRNAQLAVTYEQRAEYTDLVASLQNLSGELKVQPILDEAAEAEKAGDWASAVDLYLESTRMAPDNGRARLRLAICMSMAGSPPEDITLHAQRACVLLPREAEAQFVLGVCYEKAGKQKAAVRALQKAVELKPTYGEAKKRLRTLKWGF